VRAKIGILVITLSTTVAATGCGGSSSQTSTAISGASSTASASPSDSMSASAAASGSAAAQEPVSAASIPQITTMEEDSGNDGDVAKIPQGTTEAKAKAAGMGTDGAPVITVTGTDTSCIPDKTTVRAGKVWIKIVSKGTKITEMYLEDTKGEELIEIEKIKPGQAGAFSKKITKGSYLIACEPGMADKQIRTPLTVT
jgi:hypothetical protein